MNLLGCDVGTFSVSAVLMNGDEIESKNVVLTEPKEIKKTAKETAENALSEVDLTLNDIDYCLSTGWGRKEVPFVDANISELACHGKGAHWFVPSARTVVDLGCQGTRSINVDENGKVEEYSTNNKCAAGAGRFLEVMSEALEVDLEEMGDLGRKSEDPVDITSQCSVFAESEVITYVNEGEELANIVQGINKSIAGRTASLVKRGGIREDVVVTGGGAKNEAVVEDLEEILPVEVEPIPGNPQFVAAVGAALLAGKKASSD